MGIKRVSDFAQFQYANKQDALIPNLASKVVYGNYIKSYEQFTSEIVKLRVDFLGGKWSKIIMVTNDLSSIRKLRKVQKKKLSKKCDFRFKNIKKPESPK